MESANGIIHYKVATAEGKAAEKILYLISKKPYKLNLDLSIPKDCRNFIEKTRDLIAKGITSISFDSGREVALNSMSDNDAISIANNFSAMLEEVSARKESRELRNSGKLN